ncbi:hypothetical protein GLOTRDRAFT_135431 [Gloeophyllum trabeum ATCC 11539]|uniref:Uncharacterized protein n=1 Tax=Gloeophyllum trabeum (strain ATCC 11539 / FP-39264 / Madison 617) TaxID=670483 RepID=S7QMM0_GLOTA|nr:uncharacterized protein GLOTRDRAFT_135431 [Gloeophyllum trabeum ATCC 11539]EPQ60816.1 hypothetical protein GLOTRDRAFT_135431 [Gloeophyllum trabeum ATCC 11539]
MADFIQGLDPSKLVLAGAVMSFVIAPFTSPSYNLPIFLFGIYAQEQSEATQSMKAVTGFIGVSALFDLIFLFSNGEARWWSKLLVFLIMLLKLPTFVAFGAALRQRGAQFSGLGNNFNGNTVWSMPGGFTSLSGGARDGYESVDDASVNKPQPPVPANNGQNQSAPGAYQSV